MRRQWLKHALFVATALVAWLVAMPARAEAPMCDPRGAVTFAPAPQLPAPTTSIDVGPMPADCSDDATLLRHFSGGHAPLAELVQSSEPAATNALPAIPSPADSGFAYVIVAENAGPHGVASSVERPPRG
jgi:hypothetical protein